MKFDHQWYTIWHTPEKNEAIAYIGLMRIAEIGGTSRQQFVSVSGFQNIVQINQGMAVLQKWCRLNCTMVPMPVNVRGKTGFAFTNSADALLFKLTWS